MICVCGIPNKAAFHLHVIVSRPHECGFGTETDYSDIYLCRRHGADIEDQLDVRNQFRFDDADLWEILEWELSDLGR